MEPPFLEVQNLSVRYLTGEYVLRDVSFSLGDGEVAALMGPSGSGKTTLFRAIAGLLRNYQGASSEGDVRINGMTPKAAQRAGLIGMMFQDDYLMPHLSLLENVRLPLRLLKRPVNNAAELLLESVGLGQLSEELPSTLSGGMRARVALARAFVTKPKFVLLDEPFGSLDLTLKTRLYEDFGRLMKSNAATGMVITHEAEDAASMCDSVVMISREGTIELRIARENKPAEDFREKILKILSP